MAGPAGGASAGGNYGGNVNASQTYGGKEYRDQSYATKESVDRADARAKQREVKAKQRIAEIKAEEIKAKDLGITGPLKINYKPSYFKTLRNKFIENSINRNKVLAMRKLNLMEKGLPGLYGNFISGMTGQVPDWAKDLTQEELMGIATSGPYLSQQKTVGDVNKFTKGKDLLDRVTEAESILATGNFPQSEYDRLFPSNIPPTIGGDGQDQPYLLPINYNTGAALPIDDVAEEKTFDYRFGNEQKVGADVLRGYVANGGRITRAGGGIMNAIPRQGYFLGKIVKGVGKAIGSVADAAGKVLKSDLGKAALAGAAFYYGGGGGNPFTAAGRGGFSVGNFFSKANPLLFSANEAGKQVFNPLKMAGLITLGGAAMGPAKQDSLEGFDNRGGSLIDPLTGKEAKPAEMRASLNEALNSADGDPDKIAAIQKAYAFLGPDERLGTYLPYPTYGVKDGGRIRAQEGGLMNLGGMEKDYRAEGGFVPIGKAEKADDVPARLSVNEFVFTADAVRNAGGGDIDKGAEVMENMMKNLENGGRVSEESQGNAGAQEMFSVSERIGEVI